MELSVLLAQPETCVIYSLGDLFHQFIYLSVPSVIITRGLLQFKRDAGAHIWHMVCTVSALLTRRDFRSFFLSICHSLLKPPLPQWSMEHYCL